MADDNNEIPCEFRWELQNPFVPWRPLEATFFFDTPALTQWKVVFKPTNRQEFRYVTFQFSLTCTGIDEEHSIPDIISVQKLEVNIARSNRLIIEGKQLAYDFKEANGYTYEFQTLFYQDPKYDINFLSITIKFTFPQRYDFRRVRTGSELSTPDLMQLSEDFWLLFNHSLYTNLDLKSTTSEEIFRTHSYMMRARWNNFFAESPFRAVKDEKIEFEISPIILMDIVHYMYSCKMGTAEYDWKNPTCMTELFQVIDWYGLHHLYKVFVRNDWHQVRATLLNLNRYENRFPLDDFYGHPYVSPSFICAYETPNGELFVFKIDVYFQSIDPYFIYSLESRAKCNLMVRVNLGFGRRFPAGEVVSPFHEHDFWIRPGETVQSGTCIMRGCRSEVTLFKNECDYVGNRIRIRVLHFIHYVLSVSDGKNLILLRNGRESSLQDHLQRVEGFGDQMWDLLQNRTDADLHVTCRCQNPSDPAEIRHLHKGIFAARVSKWREVLENVPGGNPDEMTCFLKSEAFDRVLEYIYTGKCHDIPSSFYDEVDSFATRGRFRALRNLVKRLRLENAQRTDERQ